MKWTKELPTKPGWYWSKVSPSHPSVVQHLIFDSRIGRITFLSTGDPVDDDAFKRFHPQAKWSGPIPEPEEAE